MTLLSRNKRIFTEFTDLSGLSIAGIPGTQNRIVKFSLTGLTSSSLFDDGITVELDSGKWFTGESGESILDFGTTGSEYWSLSRDGDTAGTINYTTGWAYGDVSLSQLGFGEGSSISYFNSDITGISGAATDGTNTASFQFTRTGNISISTADGVHALSISGTSNSLGISFTGNNITFPVTSTGQVLVETAITTEVLVPDTSVTVKIGGVTYKLLARA